MLRLVTPKSILWQVQEYLLMNPKVNTTGRINPSKDQSMNLRSFYSNQICCLSRCIKSNGMLRGIRALKISRRVKWVIKVLIQGKAVLLSLLQSPLRSSSQLTMSQVWLLRAVQKTNLLSHPPFLRISQTIRNKKFSFKDKNSNFLKF